MLIEDLVARVFATRNAVHLLHWKTKSFAEHSALGDFYDALIDGIDEIIEDYQGMYGLIGDVVVMDVSPESMIDHISEEALWIEDHRDMLSQGCHGLEARLDDFVSVHLKVVYKLSNLS